MIVDSIYESRWSGRGSAAFVLVVVGRRNIDQWLSGGRGMGQKETLGKAATKGFESLSTSEDQIQESQTRKYGFNR
jgi:hypothetical protein